MFNDIKMLTMNKKIKILSTEIETLEINEQTFQNGKCNAKLKIALAGLTSEWK